MGGKTKIMMNLANPAQAFEESFIPNSGISSGILFKNTKKVTNCGHNDSSILKNNILVVTAPKILCSTTI